MESLLESEEYLNSKQIFTGPIPGLFSIGLSDTTSHSFEGKNVLLCKLF